MNSPLYHVIFKGEIAKGVTVAQVKQNLSSLFKLDTQHIEKAFSAPPMFVKERVDYQTALKYKAAFEKAGTVCHIVPNWMMSC